MCRADLPTSDPQAGAVGARRGVSCFFSGGVCSGFRCPHQGRPMLKLQAAPPLYYLDSKLLLIIVLLMHTLYVLIWSSVFPCGYTLCAFSLVLSCVMLYSGDLWQPGYKNLLPESLPQLLYVSCTDCAVLNCTVLVWIYVLNSSWERNLHLIEWILYETSLIFIWTELSVQVLVFLTEQI